VIQSLNAEMEDWNTTVGDGIDAGIVVTFIGLILDPTIGSEIKKKRPCVIIGATPINEARRTVVCCAPFFCRQPRPPLTIPIKCQRKQVVAVCDQIRAVDKSRLVEKIESASQENISEIEKGLRQRWHYKRGKAIVQTQNRCHDSLKYSTT